MYSRYVLLLLYRQALVTHMPKMTQISAQVQYYISLCTYSTLIS